MQAYVECKYCIKEKMTILSVIDGGYLVDAGDGLTAYITFEEYDKIKK